MVMLFFTSMMSDGQPLDMPVGVVDQDNTSTTRSLVQRLDAFQNSRVTAHYPTVSEARRAIQQNKIYGFFYIPKGTTDQLLSSRQPKVSFYYSMASITGGSLVFKDMKTIATLGSAAVGQATLRARGFTDSQIETLLQPIRIDLHQIQNPQTNYNVYLSTMLIPGLMMLFMFLITAYSLGTELKFGTSKQWLAEADGNILVSGGTVWTRAMGDSGSEGIETKGTYTQEGGTVAVYSVDDAVNSKSSMTINDGFLYGYATGNDGIDSNGNLTVNGGVLIGCGAGVPEEGVDAAEGYQFIVNGGTVIGIGGGGESVSGSQQKAAVSGVSVSGGSYISVSNGSTALFALKLPCQYNNATVQLSSPKFSSNTTYSFLTASDVSGDEVFGFIAAPTISSSSSLTSFTTSSSISGGMGGGMGGGNQGGGPGGGMGGSSKKSSVLVSCAGMTSGTSYSLAIGSTTTSVKASTSTSSSRW